MDERIKKLAKVLVNHSCRVQKGEKVYKPERLFFYMF